MSLKKRSVSKGEKGIALLSSLSLISVMSILSISLMTTALVEVRSAERLDDRMFAFHLADGAIDQTIVTLRGNRSYAGIPTTSANNGRINGTYRTTVTRSSTNADVYSIAAFGTIGSTGTSYGYQQRQITAVVQMPASVNVGAGVFASDAIAISGTAEIDAYDSRLGPYSYGTATHEGHIGTNRSTGNAIALSGRACVKGDATVGPGGDRLRNIVTSGAARIMGTRRVAASRTVLASPSPPPNCTNLGNVSLAGGTQRNLPGGDYLLTGLQLAGRAQLNFTGPARLYVRGHVTISGGGIATSQNTPANLELNILRGGTFQLAGSADLYGKVYAPQSHAMIAGSSSIYGSITSNTLAHSGSGNIHVDKALFASPSGGSSVTSSSAAHPLKAWTEVSY